MTKSLKPPRVIEWHFKVKAFLEAGLTVAEAARKADVTERQVYRWLKRREEWGLSVVRSKRAKVR